MKKKMIILVSIILIVLLIMFAVNKLNSKSDDEINVVLGPRLS